MSRLRHLVPALGLALAAFPAWAACPYTSVQIRVQPNTSLPWATSASIPLGRPVHIGAFKNGWGVPVDPGTVQVWAIQGSLSQPVSLASGGDASWTVSVVSNWTFQVNCQGLTDSATVRWGAPVNVLSYVLPNPPIGLTTYSVDTNLHIPWRTFSRPGGNVGERLPGFFITKGNHNGTPAKAWNFEEMIYDSTWIYLVRDTSWTDKCTNNGHRAAQLLLTLQNNQWVRGGRHFPRTIANGGTVAAGPKLIQGVQMKNDPLDNTVGEGQWCNTIHGGNDLTSIVAGEVIPVISIGGGTFTDVLKLSIVRGTSAGDQWWFAKGIGLIKFAKGTFSEQYNGITTTMVDVRIPCEPAAPCM